MRWTGYFLDIEEKQFNEILKDIIEYPLELFSSRIRKTSVSLILDVILDHLENPYGSVSLDDCEAVSKKLIQKLGGMYPDLDYQLRVQSAGAERKLRIPKDLYRFIGLNMNLEYIDSQGNIENGIFRLIDAKGEYAILEPYSKNLKKNKKQTPIQIGIEQIRKGRLVVIV